MFTAVFHSFKGGAGRSVTTYNTLSYLARQLQATTEQPILVIDMDIDSCGLTYLFDTQDYYHGQYDLKRFFSVPRSANQMRRDDPLDEHDFFKYTCTVGHKLGVEDAAVRFFGVNDKDDQEFSPVSVTNTSLEKILDACRIRNFKAVIFDSSSGDQVSAKVSIAKSNVIVSCMRPSKQFRTGTFAFLARLVEENLVGSDTRVIVNPTCVPTKELLSGSRELTLANILDDVGTLERRIHNRYDDRYQNLIVTDMIGQPHFGIPEIERFKWEESNLFYESTQKKLDSYETAAMSEYEFLSKCIISASGR